MRKWICLLLALALLLTAAAGVYAETPEETPGPENAVEEAAKEDEEDYEEDAGDDSVQIPVDVPEGNGEEETGAAMEMRTLQIGDEGDDVLFLQLRLQNLGYLQDKADGKYGESTAAAVKAFQIDYRGQGLDPTGSADTGTQLMAANARYRGLRKGSRGDDVRALQERLTELGFYGLKGQSLSTEYGEGTKNGVIQFQKYNGLEQTGEATPAVLELIYSDAAIGRYDEDALENAPTPTPNMDPYYVVDESDNGVPMPEEPVPFQKELKSGLKNSDLVTMLQKRMHELGYYDGPESGNFANQTLAAVKKIQKQNGMEQTGIVDETIWNLIFNDPGLVLPNQEPKPTPKPTYFIIVDVNNQIVTVWGLDEENEYRVPIRYMLCSSGNKSTPTPVGRHVLNGRKSRWCFFPKWGDWARYWTRINAQVAFHSPIHREADASTLKENTYKRLGNRASHGCVRLSNEDAKWIFDNVGAGTTVWVREDMPRNNELKTALMAEKPATSKSAKPSTTPEPAYSADEIPQIRGTIAQGCRDAATVYWIQRRLQELGYYNTKCTGTFKNMTEDAVKAFQADHGYARSGYVSQELIDLMAAETQKVYVVPADAEP